MSQDYRQDAIAYYDKFGVPPPVDIEFYRSFVSKTTRLLELGCGTGRVLVPLAGMAAYGHGLDHSSSMLALCRQKLETANIRASQAAVEVADITNFDLTDRMPKFDLITAPFRVMQNLETDQQITGLMRCIKRHLADGGEAILNTYYPRGVPDELKAIWDKWDGREPAWTQPDGEGTVSLTENCTRYRENPLTVFPRLTYRRYDACGTQTGEAAIEFAMRVWYPDELITMIESHGFVVTSRFGGYEGEPWGEGRELVVAFKHA
jgi:SAM-dependent methyltransferase